MTVFLSNDLVTCKAVAEYPLITVTTDDGDSYVRIDNSEGYTYIVLPFTHTEETMNAENMIVTINELIKDGLFTDVLRKPELSSAINTALKQAKDSGEFDGADGTSVTVSSVTESSADGGSNVVEFSDGKQVTIKNGSKGSTPVKGTDYFTDADKEEMVTAVKATLTSETWVFTLEDGSTVTKVVLLG
jgi:hypothetical protein